MTTIAGILGAAVLFALLGFSATRYGSRLEGTGGCHGDSCDLDSCSLHQDCDGCGDEKSPSGWWPSEHAHYGDR